MSQSISTAGKSEDRSMAGIISLIIHAVLLAILIFYRFPAPVAPEDETIVIDFGGGGDNAAAGEPDRGMFDDPAPQGQQMDDPSSKTESPDPTPTPTPTPPTPSKPTPAPPSNNSPTTEDPNVAAVRKQQEEARKRQQQEEENNRRIEQERKAAAEQEAARKRQEEADRAAKKGKFGSTFGQPGGTGTGAGGGGKPGNGGVPGGTGDNPFGKSSGTGGGTGGGSGTGSGPLVGGGLSNRRPLNRSIPTDNSQDHGIVVVDICVDAAGNVTSATYAMRGSTTQSSNLKSKAIAAARAWKFVPGSDNECGTIAFNFKLK